MPNKLFTSCDLPRQNATICHMFDDQIQIRCQRCGAQMELKDPEPGTQWPPQQFWECLKCGRHFWTTYPPPKPSPPKPTGGV